MLQGEARQQFEGFDAGCTRKILVLRVDFVSGSSDPRSLKSQVSEEICGRFGSFDGSTTVHISNYLEFGFGHIR